jgi:hypothetical protein
MKPAVREVWCTRTGASMPCCTKKCSAPAGGSPPPPALSRLCRTGSLNRTARRRENLLDWIEITCESESPEVHQKLATQLYEAISEIAFLHGIHLHNEEESLSRLG